MPTHKIIDYLKQLELTDEEATIYLTLLQTGPVSVKSLAGETDIKRTTAYLYINSLIEKGLIAKIVKGSQKMVAANDPHDSLEYLVKKKIEKAEALKSSFPMMLETITNSLPQLDNVDNAEIKYYKGRNGILKIYEAAIKTNELRSYVKLEETGGIFSDNLSFFNQAFKKNVNLQIRELLYNSPLSKEQTPKVLSVSNRYFYKFMPPELKLTSGDILIYDGNVAIINYNGNMDGVILHNRDFYNTSKELFDYIWKTLPETK